MTAEHVYAYMNARMSAYRVSLIGIHRESWDTLLSVPGLWYLRPVYPARPPALHCLAYRLHKLQTEVTPSDL